MAAVLTLLLAATPAMAQMMGNPDQHMTQQQQQRMPQQQNYPYQMNPNMMGGYGYGMGPQMMGGYGYGMGPQMMGGYGMGPQMMGGYGYGMGPQMMGSCGLHQPYYGSTEDYTKFLDDTKDQRRKMHALMFEYGETARSPNPDKEKLQKMEKEMNELRTEIFNFKTK